AVVAPDSSASPAVTFPDSAAASASSPSAAEPSLGEPSWVSCVVASATTPFEPASVEVTPVCPVLADSDSVDAAVPVGPVPLEPGSAASLPMGQASAHATHPRIPTASGRFRVDGEHSALWRQMRRPDRREPLSKPLHCAFLGTKTGFKPPAAAIHCPPPVDASTRMRH